MTVAPTPADAPGRTVGRGPRALVVLLLLLAAVLVAPSAPSAAASAQERDGALSVELTAVDPAFLSPGQDLSVRGVVRNGSSDALAAVTVTLALQRNPPGSRFALDAWLNPETRFATLLLDRRALGGPLPAGGSATFSFTVPAEDVPLRDAASAWGPRGLTATADAGSRTAAVRTFLVWNPALPVTPDRVSIVLPLTPTPGDLLGAVLAGESVPTQSSSRVEALAGATAATRSVAWALDPVLLEPEPSAAPTGSPTTPAPPTPAGPTEPVATRAPSTGSPQTAAPGASTAPSTPGTTPAPGPSPSPDGDGSASPASELATTLLPLASGREVVALPYADADAAALVHQDRLDLYDQAAEIGRSLTEASGIATLPGIAWPAGTRTDAATASALADRGASTLVLPQTSLPLARELTYTPTGRATVSLGDGEEAREIGVLLAEPTLSAALAGIVPREADAGGGGADLAARQYALALTAMISRERPNDVQHLLAVVPRAFDGDPAALGERVNALAAAPWVDVAPLSVLLGTQEPSLARAELTAKLIEEGEVPADILDQVTRTRARLADFASIAADPQRLVLDEQRRLLQVTAAAWRSDPGGRSSFANAARAAAADLPRQVAVLPTGTVNLISETGELPITVRNALSQPISAYLRLTPEAPSLQVPTLVEVNVPANSEVAVGVGVSAVGSADIGVQAQLLDRQGRPVGDPATLFVRVRADWENVGTAVVAGLLGIVFLLGLARSIRRSRRRRTASSAGTAP